MTQNFSDNLASSESVTRSNAILTLSCEDKPGIVASVAGCLFEHGANIIEAQHYNDDVSSKFFSRIAFTIDTSVGVETFLSRLKTSLAIFRPDIVYRDRTRKVRVLILVSRFDHCLADLLYRWRIGELNIELVGVISNYPREAFPTCNLDGVRFDHLPISPDTKKQQEAQILQLVNERSADLVVLARYMQILSGELATQLSGRCINIHHSFLPGFKGAKPYQQAHTRGVKIIGATAHYVTGDLDEGPIIEQDVERISHFDTAAALVRKGRDIERRVLSRAVQWHVDSRVILNGSRTVVFRD